MAGEIKKLEELCVKFGGKLLKVTQRQFQKMKEEGVPIDGYRTFFEANFSSNDLGIHWPSRTIVYAGKVLWWEVVHEMGHVFAQQVDPNASEDEEEFIGWEYLLVKQVGDLKPWLEANENFSTGDLDLGDLTLGEQIAYLERSVLRGQELGIIGKDRKLWAYARTFKFEEVREELIVSLENIEHRLDAKVKLPVTDGRDFEERCKMEGMVRGYRAALAEVMTLLDRSFTSPMPPLGKR
jgi:hypothetical protein